MNRGALSSHNRRLTMISKFLNVLLLLGLTSAVNAAEEAWISCSTPKTQFVLTVPGSLIHSTAPTATGCSFQTSEGDFTVEAVQLDPIADVETLDGRMQKEIEVLGGTVSYKKKGDNWFVISGTTPDGTEYYRKIFTNGSQWITLRITYPHAGHKQFDKWVTRIEKTFKPFGPGEEKKEEKRAD
jgi:hypothetical protein